MSTAEERVALLTEMATEDDAASVRLAAVTALASIDHPDAGDALNKALTDSDADVRCAAVDATTPGRDGAKPAEKDGLDAPYYVEDDGSVHLLF